VLERLVRAGGRGIPVASLEGELGAKGAELVQRLVAEGEIVVRGGSLFSPQALGWVAGTLIGLPSGDALLRTDDGPEARFYVRAMDRGTARPGDRVLVAPETAAPPPRVGRRPARAAGGRERLPHARVVQIGRRALEEVVGTVRLAAERAGERLALLEPFDPRAEDALRLEPSPLLGDPAAAEGELVVAAFPPTPAGRLPSGQIRERLGPVSTPGVDVAAILRHHHIPDSFAEAAMREAMAFGVDPTPADWAGRLDLRGAETPVVTIDGESARDFDDAVAASPLPEGGYRVAVHIADVAHYVRPGSALDQAAYERGNSVYFPDRAVPMLPEHLSNGLCSLRPGVPRLVLSVFFDVAPDGQVGPPRFARSVIQSARRLTYGEVRRLLESPAADDPQRYGPVLPALRHLAAAAALLGQRRTARGALDFDLPDADVLLDERGATVGIAPGERNVAHRLIEDLMIAANELVAAALDEAGVPALYRVHDPPGEEECRRLVETLASFGLEVESDGAGLGPAVLQRLLVSLRGRPEEPLLAALVLRAQQRARYASECRGHYALVARHYCHFTSPIRRYPDLVVHRQLTRWLTGRLDEEPDLAARLDAMAEHASETERRAAGAERDLLQWKKVRYLADRVGERFRGTVTGVTNFGLFVQIADLLVDGLVPAEDLERQGLRPEPDRYRAVGTRGERIHLGETVAVQLVGVDLRRRGLNLQLLAPGEAAGRPDPQRPGAPPVGSGGARADRRRRRAEEAGR
jgi:ribonuclease R